MRGGIWSGIEVREHLGGSPECMDLRSYVEDVNTQGVILLNPTRLFPKDHKGSRSVQGIYVRVAKTHTATMRSAGCIKGEYSQQTVHIATVQECDVAPSYRCANCILRLVGGEEMQAKAIELSTPKI